MAVRRPTLLFCIVTIVLGVHFDPRHSLHDTMHVQNVSKVLRTLAISTEEGVIFTAFTRKKRSCKDSESESSSGRLWKLFTQDDNVHSQYGMKAGDSGMSRSHPVTRLVDTVCCGGGALPRKEADSSLGEDKDSTLFTAQPTTEGHVRAGLGKDVVKHGECQEGRTMHCAQMSVERKDRRNGPTAHTRSMLPLTSWSWIFSDIALTSPSEDDDISVSGRAVQSRTVTSAHKASTHKDMHVSQDPKDQSHDGNRQGVTNTSHNDPKDQSHDGNRQGVTNASHSDHNKCPGNYHTALPMACGPKRQHDHIPQGRSPVRSLLKDVCLFFEELKQFQPKAVHFVCKTNASALEDKEEYFSEHAKEFHNVSILRMWENYESHLKRETRSRYEHQLSLACLCISLLIFRNEDLRKKVIAPLLNAFTDNTNTRKWIAEFLERITEIIGSKGSSFEHDLDKPQASGLTKSFKKEKMLPLPNINTDFAHVPNFLPKRPSGREKPDDKGRPGRSEPVTATGWLTDFPTPVPRRPLTYTMFPASFFPSLGSSAKDAMSHLGCRLASLNSLPASCKTSRVRLAQAGFYYDTAKTSRQDSDVHEVTCYSCGVSYSQWKDGDNPRLIHELLRPECLHLKESTINNSNNNNSSSIRNENSNRLSLMSTTTSTSSNASSGYWSMNEGSLGSSRSLSSDHTNSTDSSAQERPPPAVADGRPGSGPSAVNHAQHLQSSAPRTDSAVYRNNNTDLATDCAAIAPAPVTSTIPSTNQRTTPRPARDTAIMPPSNQSSFMQSADPSSAGAQRFDDRPPVSMEDAVYPQFARLQERLATFSTWPLGRVFDPDNLVMQGFYYAGYADCIRCFYCGVGLKSWCEEDDVMTEHIRWRPSCGYILNTKGRHFVNTIVQRIQASEQQTNQTSQDNQGNTGATSTTTTTTTNGARQTAPVSTASLPPPRTSPPRSTRTPSPLPARNSAPSASAPSAAPHPAADRNAGASAELLRTVEDMGFPRNTITRAVRHLQQEGETQIGVDRLVETILELDEDGGEDEGSGDGDGAQLQTDGPEEASAAGADVERAQRLQSENDRLRERNTCRLCRQAKVGMIFLPCGHILACADCGSRVRHCSTCGGFIKATANVYI